MSQYHKIWIEVDVDKMKQKTELIKTIVEALQKIEGIIDVTKTQYISSGEKVRSELELE